jgi:hypothetical protein
MAEFYLRKMLGGVANGEDASSDWSGISEWVAPGTTHKSVYQQRSFYSGADRFIVWVEVSIPEAGFQMIMTWHREMYRGDLVSAQKELLKESMAAAGNYANVIMVAGYAALFTFWSQSRDFFTPMTSFSAAIALAVSVLAFVGWEVFGMIVRARINIGISKAVGNPARFEQLMLSVSEDTARTTRTLYPAWLTAIAVAVGFGLVCFGILLSGFIHAAWLSVHG